MSASQKKHFSIQKGNEMAYIFTQISFGSVKTVAACNSLGWLTGTLHMLIIEMQ